jgi:hypothetical protein
MATSSRREPNGLLTSATRSKRCAEQGSEGDSTPFGAFRFAVLRRAGAPENLIKLWLGHSQNLMDHYAARLRHDVVYVGNGARKRTWDLSWANWVTNWELQFARHSLRKPIPRQALEMVAGVRFELTTFGL